MGNLKVIGGKARGFKLLSVPGDTTRPVTDRVKEACFNILGGDVQDASFWDLFGGTGAIGIEALSRGAASVRFTEINRQAVQIIQANLEHTGFTGQAEILRADAFAVLKQAPNREFDYVYIAPPQYKELWSQALLALDGNPGWLSSDAWVIAQIHPKEYQPLECHNLVEFDRRHYGSTLLIFYEYHRAA